MGSDYRLLCLNHRPPLWADREVMPATTVEESIRRLQLATAVQSGHPHQACDLVIGVYSMPLIKVVCPGHRHGHTDTAHWHTYPIEVELDWLRLMDIACQLAADNQGRGEDYDSRLNGLFVTAMQGRLMSCWPMKRIEALHPLLWEGTADDDEG